MGHPIVSRSFINKFDNQRITKILYAFKYFDIQSFTYLTGEDYISHFY